MGLFSRKDGATPRKPAARPRPSVSSEAQAAELRVRARRRLAGAVALVLAAVVVLPMLLDAERQPVPDNIAIRIPDRNSPFQPSLSEPPASEPDSGSGGPVQDVAAPAAVAAAATASSLVAAPPASSPSMSAPSPAAKAEPKPEPKPDPKVKPDAASKAEARAQANAPSSRTDDGARALALLEGRPTASATPPTGSAPPAVKPQEKGNFVVQAASLDTAADAQGQRDKLTAAGLSNAFVDGPVAVNGKQKYRVRVGPFPSREAAQAAQTRLRTLGFGGAFIASQ